MNAHPRWLVKMLKIKILEHSYMNICIPPFDIKKLYKIYSLRFCITLYKSFSTLTLSSKYNFDFSFLQNIYCKVIHVYFYESIFQDKSIYPF
jgi:hypothetical protein